MKRRAQAHVIKGLGKPRPCEGQVGQAGSAPIQAEGTPLARMKWYRILFEGSRDAIYITSKGGTIIDANQSCIDLLGYTEKELKGLNVSELYVTAEDRLRFQHEVERTGFAHDFKGRLRTKDGGEIDCLLTATMQWADDGGLLRYQVIIHDINEHTQQGAYAELEDRVAERTAELLKVNEMLQAEITERRYAEEINQALFSISNAVNTTRNLDELYCSIHQSLGRVIDTTNFFIALYNKEQDVVIFPYHVDEIDSVGDYDRYDMSHASKSGSLTAEVIKTGKPLFMKKKERLEWIKRLNKRITGTPAEVWLGVPLKIKKEVIGVMAIQSYADPHRFSRRDLDILLSVCDQVALAIERKQAEEALRQSEEITRVLFRISNAVNTTDNLDEFYRFMHTSLSQVIDLKNFYIALYDRQTQTILFPYVVDEVDETIFQSLTAQEIKSSALTGRVLRTGSPLLIKKEEMVHQMEEQGEKIFGHLPEVWLGVPLKVKGEIIGVMATQCYTDPNRYSQGDLDILLSVCDQVAVAIERKQAEEALRESEEINRTLFSISNAVNTTRNLDELYCSIHQSLGRVIDTTNFFIALYDKQSDSLLLPYWVDEIDTAVPAVIPNVTGPHSVSHAAIVIRAGEPILHRKGDFLEYLRQRNLKPMTTLSEIWLGVPLKTKGEVIGVMAVHSHTNPNLYSQKDVDILLSVSDQVTLAIERKQAEEAVAEHKETLKRSFFGTAEALSKVIEDRDPYTGGHSAGVARVAVDIAHEMGLPEEKITGIYIASILHDIGKMAVPVEILVKPGRLAELEMSLIRRHAQTGYEILKGIGFPWPVAQITLQHHERMNGSGYPQELKGEEIILEARILAVADVVDAMTHHRPYRPALSLDETKEELMQGRGSIYDPLVVDTCIRVLERGLSPSTSSYAMSSTSPHVRKA